MKRTMAAAAGRALLAATAAAALLLLAGCARPPAQQPTQTAAGAPAGPEPQAVPAPSPEELGVTPESPKALYARIGLVEGEDGVMVLMLDESGGEDSGYDTLYADTDLDGKLTGEGEKLVANEARKHSNLSMAQFGPIQLDLGEESPARQLAVIYTGLAGRNDHTLRVNMEAPPSATGPEGAITCLLMGEPALAATPGEAAVWRAFGEAALEMQTQPSRGRQLCVALTAKLGDAEIHAREAEVDLVIRTPDGQVVHRDHGYLRDFGFG